MPSPRSRTLALTGLLGAALLHAAAQQPASPPAPVAQGPLDFSPTVTPPPPAPAKPVPSSAISPTSPNLFPSTTSGGPVPDFSGSNAAPASSFAPSPSSSTNIPDFSRSSVSSAVAGASGGGTGGSGGSGSGANGTGTANGTGSTAAPTGGGGGFAPGPFSSPASTTPTTPNGVAAPASVYGTTTLGSGTGLGAGSGTGTAGLGGANTRTPNPSTPTNFTLPGGYGQAPLTFSAGQGRLARPRYVFTSTVQFGYDDNILQTPTSQLGQPAQFQTVQTQAEIPDQKVIVVVPPPPGPHPIGIKPAPVIKVETIKGQPAVFEKQLVSPAVVPQERIGSAEARTSAGFEMQLSNSKTVFTADAHVSLDYYLDRPGDQTDINGNVAFLYAHRFSARLQFSTNVSAAYLSQPDLRVVSGPTRQVGDYLTYNSKSDLSYQWSKRISTVTSLTLGALDYQNEVQKTNNNYTIELGNEFRYTWSPRITLVGEVRASEVTYSNGTNRDSTTYFLLTGGDYAISRRLSGTVRVGESIRSFEEGGNKSSPYLETTAAFRFSNTGTLSWSSRFGFEEPQDANSEVQVFRTSLSAVQAFTSRLRGSVSVGYIHSVTSQDQSLTNQKITGDTYTADVGLDYALTRKFSINASYSFINDVETLEQSGYYRNQIFFGGQYTF